MKVSYKVVQIDRHEFLDKQINLKKLGEDGWELCGISRGSGFERNHSYRENSTSDHEETWLFKREKE